MNSVRPGLGALLLLLALQAWPRVALANPCAEDPGGIGGTGISRADPGGIGGTGLSDDDPGGMGGTGIVGTITGFGSICVNGIEIHYDYRTQIDSRGLSLGRSFELGQVVAVRASGTGAEVTATRIVPIDELAGPITSIDPDGARISVMGRIVDISEARTTSERRTASPNHQLNIGDFVRVSGLSRTDLSVKASLLSLERDTEQAQVTGTLTAEKGVTRVAGVPVILRKGTGATAGSEVRVRGRWTAGSLEVRNVEIDPIGRIVADLPMLELQGYWHSGARPGGPKLWGKSIAIHENTSYSGGAPTQLPSEARVRVRVQARPGAELSADSIVFEPGPAGRKGNDERPKSGSSNTGGNQAPPAGATTATSPVTEPPQEWGERKGKAEPELDIESREKPDKPGKPDKPDKPDKPSRPDKADRPERAERPEKVDRPQRIERPDKIERPERIERPEKVERLDKPERPAKPDRPEKASKPDRR